ncbi:DUF1127 domain-containing protein [Frigidibacter oleivorans]|uniref:DUF1127 domain-containing protein n=1 Tax=Frigidibacter oleivorans TaxID=2487129 RepID=UPI001F36D7E6|nr:DUF1127 domain-containing protein [Frigidibacter oleivorans]
MTTLPLNATPAATTGAVRRAVRGVAVTIADYRLRRATRLALRRLDARLLRDIGVAPDHAAHEAEKPFWRA